MTGVRDLQKCGLGVIPDLCLDGVGDSACKGMMCGSKATSGMKIFAAMVRQNVQNKVYSYDSERNCDC